MHKFLTCPSWPRYYDLYNGTSNSLLVYPELPANYHKINKNNYTATKIISKTVGLSGTGVQLIGSDNSYEIPVNAVYEINFYSKERSSPITNYNYYNVKDWSRVPIFSTSSGTGGNLGTTVTFNNHYFVYQAANDSFRIDLELGDYVDVHIRRNVFNKVDMIALYYHIYKHDFTFYSLSYYFGSETIEYKPDVILYEERAAGAYYTTWDIDPSKVVGPYCFDTEDQQSLIVFLPTSDQTTGYASCDGKNFVSFSVPEMSTWLCVTPIYDSIIAINGSGNKVLYVGNLFEKCLNPDNQSVQIYVALNALPVTLSSNPQIVFANDYFLIKSDYHILKSTDLMTWSIKYNSYYQLSGNLVYSAREKTWYVSAVVDDSKWGYRSSDNGNTWRECPSDTSAGGYYTDYVCSDTLGVVFRYKNFDGTTPSETQMVIWNGSVWATRNFPMRLVIKKVQCINNIFIVIPEGNTSEIYWSTNLQSWNQLTVGQAADWPLFKPVYRSITVSSMDNYLYSNYQWISITPYDSTTNKSNVIIYYPDSNTFSRTTKTRLDGNFGFGKDYYLFKNGYFVAYSKPTTSSNTIIYSNEGLSWYTAPLPANTKISNIGINNLGIFIKDTLNNKFLYSKGLENNGSLNSWIDNVFISNNRTIYSRSTQSGGGGTWT